MNTSLYTESKIKQPKHRYVKCTNTIGHNFAKDDKISSEVLNCTLAEHNVLMKYIFLQYMHRYVDCSHVLV